MTVLLSLSPPLAPPLALPLASSLLFSLSPSLYLSLCLSIAFRPRILLLDLILWGLGVPYEIINVSDVVSLVHCGTGTL